MKWFFYSPKDTSIRRTHDVPIRVRVIESQSSSWRSGRDWSDLTSLEDNLQIIQDEGNARPPLIFLISEILLNGWRQVGACISTQDFKEVSRAGLPVGEARGVLAQGGEESRITHQLPQLVQK